MASFSNQVAWKTGDSTAYTTQMPTWLNDGVRDVVDRVVAINPGYKRHFAAYNSGINDSGFTVETQHVLAVYRNDSNNKPVLAPLIPTGVIAAATSTGSIYSATETHPVSYVRDGKLYVHPLSGSTGVAWLIDYGTVDDSGGTISNFPSSLYELVVLFASMRATEYRIATLRGEMRSYIDTDEDSELAQLKAAEVAKSEALLGRLASEYAAGFDRVKGEI